MSPSLENQLVQAQAHAVSDLLLAANGLATVSAALDHPASHPARDIADSGKALHARASRCHATLIGLTAGHAPVAGDLRLVLALIELAHHCHLLANQFELIAEQLAELDPTTRDPARNAKRLAAMAAIASAQLRKATEAFRMRDLVAARELDRDDDQLDALNREVCDAVASRHSTAEERDLGFRHVLIARSLERIGDNAVDIGEQAAFLVTAQRPEFADAAQPRRSH